MSSRRESTGVTRPRPRSRRSIAHVPRTRTATAGDKENATLDIGAPKTRDDSAKAAAKEKKSRSKSLGPGGLDALQDSNGNRRKSTTAFPLKSILKPTVPVSPVRNIPTFEETRRRTPARRQQQEEENNKDANDGGNEGFLIDLNTPAHPSASASEERANPFDSFNAEAIRDEMAATREREEKERAERERKAILQQREARRKSMANRRVSFAPEATLHTWNVVEIPDDSTSSSTSNSTRRASSLQNAENQPPAPAPAQEEPSSPDDADSDITFSPVKYQDLQQLANRPQPSSYDGMGSSQEMSSSPFSGSSVGGSEDAGMPSPARDDDESSSDSEFDGESTAMSMDETVRSSATMQSEASEPTSSSARLNDALQQAAREAGKEGLDQYDNGEMSMEIADQEITGAFQPWIKKGQRQSFDWEDISARHDQENAPTREAADDFAHSDAASDDIDEELSMDVTSAIGRILSKPQSRRQSAVRRKSVSEETTYDEQTMELTNVVGGITLSTPAKSVGGDSNANEDEEMTMEFTTAVGGVLNRESPSKHAGGYDAPMETDTPQTKRKNGSGWDEEADMDEGMDMEMTGAVGGILPAAQEEETESQDDDQTTGMDVTTALGQILPPNGEADQSEADQATGPEAAPSTIDNSPVRDAQPSPAKTPVSFHLAAVASESGSPSLASVRTRRTRQSLGRRASTTPTSNAQQSSPHEEPPAEHLTPQAIHPTTPGKTPPSTGRQLRSASPRKLFQPELGQSANQRKSPGRKSLFGSSATGESTPRFVLQPHSKKRRSSGLGIDKEGLGSPRVAALLDKRRSIGEDSPAFVPKEQRPQGVRFEDPIKLQEEVDQEREEEENREDGHIPPMHPSERDATANLKDMISSLTPKKNKLRGRKSLHVGAARGVLGKRPMELDLDDEDVDSDHTPKRLKGRPASPVKKIHLPAPPSKDETVGRRTPRKERDMTPQFNTTPVQEPTTSSVSVEITKGTTGSPNVSDLQPQEEASAGAEEPVPESEPIQLQEFLNMTNIHFMELTTTKRRHTTVLDSASKRVARLSSEFADRSSAANFDDCVAAGLCTVPMLELYQHSCRELKSYISEGRQVIRSIEAETFEDNPPLFREYMTAAPDIRLLMDNQFRNVKTHARFLSKATWYEWRMKLLEGLKEGLDQHYGQMKDDEQLVSKYEALLDEAVPALENKHTSLQEEATSLQQMADEMENYDQDELRDSRETLAHIDEEIAAKKQELQAMQEEVQDRTDTIETGAELKAEFVAQIQEAERVKEECRGWSAKEINELKDSVRTIESQTGWSIASAVATSDSSSGPRVTMSYRNQLQLVFHPGSFYIENDNKQSAAGEKSSTPVELRFQPTEGANSTPHHTHLTPIGSLVLKTLQNHISTTPPSNFAPTHLLRFVSQAWDSTLKLEEEARMLEFCGVTKLKLREIDATPSLRARCTLFEARPRDKSNDATPKRIDVDFAVKARITRADQPGAIGVMDFDTDVIASKVYGFGAGNGTGISENKMRNILHKEMGGKKAALQLGNGIWSKAIQALSGMVF
ncbi:Spc7-domain-containing protein [Aspergillus campestris IBT 28561]|uniref:Spc7-domain-containing protein n=1 Tax=Aspergillus campestris (strain IBT 28561) TaxID=1392248 RepID=A0A2I1CY58_ASPC2|nr:Spc7-domain-containing protein [Aspergillus campestris IBT 28561]PKY02532.1 Spc7-domain-containing protein [Aspergillus campestris IBT 28561]